MARVRLDESYASRFHEIFCDDWTSQRRPLAVTARSSAASRLALAVGLTDDDVRHAYDEQGRHVQNALDGFLSGVGREDVERTVGLAEEIAPGSMSRPCDPDAASALLARGVNPVALLCFEIAMSGEQAPGEATVFGADGLRAFLRLLPESGARRGVPYDYAVLQLERGTWWERNELSLDVALPDTVAALAPGRMATDIVRHPFLDGLVVEEVREGGTRTVLRVSGAPEPVAWREAVAQALAAVG